MDKNALINWVHNWQRVLFQEIYQTSNGKAESEEILRSIQRFLCKTIISRMLESRGIIGVDIFYLQVIDNPGISDEMSSRVQKEIAGIDLSGFPFEILGDIYESYLAQKLVLNSLTGEYEYLPDHSTKKGKGIYYTPRHIVCYTVDQTLGKYLWGTDSGRSEGNAPVRSPDDIYNLRILDPSCGSGSFLTYIFDVLAEFYSFHCPQTNWISFILEKHIYGMDQDGDAINIANAILVLKAIDHGNYKACSTNIKQGNFLTSGALDNSSGWMQDISSGFTMILGNPPYGMRLTRSERKWVRLNYETYKSPDSSSLFIENAVNLLANNGVMGFVVPKSLSYVVSWSSIRKFLLDKCQIIEIADVSEAFSKVLLEQMIIIAQKESINDNYSLRITHHPPSFIRHISKSITIHNVDSKALSSQRFSIWLNNQRLKDLLDKIWENSIPLGNIAKIRNGLNIQRLTGLSELPDSEYKHPCLMGKNIQRYYIRTDAKYIKLTDALKHHHQSSGIFDKPKIVVQDIVAHIQHPVPRIKIMAAIDRSGNWLSANTVTNIISEYPLEYICGLLNSRLISWYAHNFIYNRAVRTMHFRNGYADYIPVYRIDSGGYKHDNLRDQLIRYVNEIVTLCSEMGAKTKITEIDKEIEELIYQLYGITDDDVRFLEENAGFY